MTDVLEALALVAGFTGTAAGSVGGYLLSRRSGQRYRRARRLHLWVLMGGLMGAVPGCLTFAAAKRQQARAAFVGTLVAARTGSHIVRYPELEFGDSGAVLRYAGPPGTPLLDFGGDPLTIGLDQRGRVLVSVVLRDKLGNLAAELVQNEWRVNPSGGWQRNYNANALEVRDPLGDVVFQVRLVDNRAKLQAKLFDRDGRGFILRESDPGEGARGGVLEFVSPAERDRRVIQPLFRYPSELHLGELAER